MNIAHTNAFVADSTSCMLIAHSYIHMESRAFIPTIIIITIISAADVILLHHEHYGLHDFCFAIQLAFSRVCSRTMNGCLHINLCIYLRKHPQLGRQQNERTCKQRQQKPTREHIPLFLPRSPTAYHLFLLAYVEHPAVDHAHRQTGRQ